MFIAWKFALNASDSHPRSISLANILSLNYWFSLKKTIRNVLFLL